MTSRKNMYLSVLFGASLILFFQRLSFIADSLVGKLFNFVNLHKVGDVFGTFGAVLIIGLGVLFCYMTLPDNYKNLDWLKRMIFIFLIGYIVLCVINSGINVLNFGLSRIGDTFTFIFRWLFPNVIIFIVLLVLTLRVSSMKEDPLGPPKLP